VDISLLNTIGPDVVPVLRILSEFPNMTVEDMWGARPPRMWKRELRTADMVLAYNIGMRLAGAA
jgi:hypothetical protein